MVNSGVLSWNRAISTDWAACYTQNTHLDFAFSGPNTVEALASSTVIAVRWHLRQGSFSLYDFELRCKFIVLR